MKKGFRIIKFKKDKPIFEIKDVSKAYDGRPILKKISMVVHSGEIVGMLGANGTGKTTMFQMCTGETSIDAGKIKINNKDIHDLPMHERANSGLAYVPQQRNHFDMSVKENILGLSQLCIKGEENQNRITERLLEEFNLTHLKNLNASVLSGGESRRLAMSKVMLNGPKVVLLDEVLAALDPIVIQDIQKYILKIQSFGCAILITDHNLRSLFDIVDRAYVLGEQSIIAEGSPTELLKSSKAVEQYFGTQFK